MGGCMDGRKEGRKEGMHALNIFYSKET